MIKSYLRNRDKIFWDLYNYAKNNNCVNVYASTYARFSSMGGHIHVSLPQGIDYETAKRIATYIKPILPLTTFLSQFDPQGENNVSRRIQRNVISRNGYCKLLTKNTFISTSHYGMISYNPIRTIEIRVHDSAPPQVLMPIAFIYATVFASAMKKGSEAPLDFLRMTENVHEYEMKHALRRRLKMSKIVIRWMALCRGDIMLPKDVAFLVWLALNRIAPMDYAKDVGVEKFYRACQYSNRSRKFYTDSFLVLIRRIYYHIRDARLRNIYKLFTRRFGKRYSVFTSELLKFYAEITLDREERETIYAFLNARKSGMNKLIQKCIDMAYRREWEYIPQVTVRRIGRGRYSRYDDAEWILNTVRPEDIDSPDDIISHRDRFYIVEDRNNERIGVIRVTWREQNVRGVWFTRELSKKEKKDLRLQLEMIAHWFADAVERLIST